jgi:hypothetical protein
LLKLALYAIEKHISTFKLFLNAFNEASVSSDAKNKNPASS